MHNNMVYTDESKTFQTEKFCYNYINGKDMTVK